MKLNVRVAGDRRQKAGIWLAVSFLVVLAGILLYAGGQGSMVTAASADSGSSPWSVDGASDSAQGGLRGRHYAGKSGSQIVFAKVPLSFEVNQGQTDSQVKFLARGGGYTLFLTQNEAILKLASVIGRQSLAKHSALSTQPSATSTAVVRMRLVGANARAAVSGFDQLPSRSNYFIGNDPSKWRRNVAQFARVRYAQVYPGIDVVYYGNQGRLEYDFEVAPGADPQQIGLQVQGAQKVAVDAKGELVAQTAAGDVQLHAPEVYQKVGDQKQAVAGKFILSADHSVRFALGEYDRSRELVIDPQLTFASYFGGSVDEGCAFTPSGTYGTPVAGCPAVAVDGALNWYVAGSTTSLDLPVTNGTTLHGGNTDVFVAKFNSSGSPVNVSYLGGSGIDTPVGIGVDPASQRVYVGGNTTSNDFPQVNGIPIGTLSAGNHVFVTLLDSTLSSTPIYSTYLAGDGNADTATGFTSDNAGNAYVTGITNSQHFPTTPGSYQATDPDAFFSQFFMSKIATSSTGLSSLAYSTYFGASNAPASGAVLQGGGIAVSAGFVYITGGTNFLHTGIAGDFPILNAVQPCLDQPGVTSCSAAVTNTDAFVAKINPVNSGTQLIYSTYVGGAGVEVPYGIAVDGSGNAYVTGSTDSTNFPIVSTTNAFQPSPGGGTDAFVAKLGSSGTPIPLSYSSYLGGSGTDVALAIAVDVDQAAHITGATSGSFPTTADAITGTGAGTGASAFVALIQTTFAAKTGGYASYLQNAGANGNTDGTGIAVDLNANTYVVGETNSTGIPVTNGSALNGTSSDAFLAKVLPTATGITITASTSVASGTTAGIGNQVTFTYTIKNTGPGVATNVLFTDFLPTSGATFDSATSSPGSCTTPVNGFVTCAIGSLGGSPSAPGQASVKINLTPTVAGPLSNNGILQASGAPAGASSASVVVSDFRVGVTPSTAAVVAGNTATYQVQVGDPAGQSSFFPNAVSLSCSAGVPTGAACTFSTNPVTLTSTSAISSTLTLTTTARPVTTGRLQQLRVWYAAILPIGGLTFLGLGVGSTRRRRWFIGSFVVLVFVLAGLQLACSSGSGTTTPPTGTPAGTYPITVTGTSGSASHGVRMTLVVQ